MERVSWSSIAKGLVVAFGAIAVLFVFAFALTFGRRSIGDATIRRGVIVFQSGEQADVEIRFIEPETRAE